MESAEFPNRPRDGVEALVREVRELKRQVDEMRSNLLKPAGVNVEPGTFVVNQSLAVRGGGHLRVDDGGFLRVRYPASLGGHSAVFFGRIVSEVSGDYQGTGFLVQGPDVTHNLMQVRTDESGDSHMFEVWDNDRTAVLRVLPTSARGLDRPTLNISVQPDDYRKWGETESTSWARVAQGYSTLWHSHIACAVRAVAWSGATAGQVRVMVRPAGGDEVQIGPVEDIGAAIAFRSLSGPMPSSISIGQEFYVTLEARVTGGAGSVSGAIVGATTRSY